MIKAEANIVDDNVHTESEIKGNARAIFHETASIVANVLEQLREENVINEDDITSVAALISTTALEYLNEGEENGNDDKK